MQPVCLLHGRPPACVLHGRRPACVQRIEHKATLVCTACAIAQNARTHGWSERLRDIHNINGSSMCIWAHGRLCV
eukprot:365196-Chlamydomonas_euryale.AAC.7